MDFASALRAVRTRAPLVQCITNFVTVNDCANITLAAAFGKSLSEYAPRCSAARAFQRIANRLQGFPEPMKLR